MKKNFSSKVKILDYSAIVLSGGYSERFGRDKGFIDLMGKPLIQHVIDKVSSVTTEIIIVVSTEKQLKTYSNAFSDFTKVVVDEKVGKSPLIGALTGFHNANTDYVFLLPCDTPLISKAFLKLLIDVSPGRSAVIPRWPNRYIEPLQAIYNREETHAAASEAFNNKSLNMRAMISKLNNVLYLSTTTIEKIDTELHTFHNINNSNDLRMANKILRLSAH